MKSIQIFKVVILGDEAVGKSSILNRLINDDFTKDYEPTIGFHYISKTLNVMNQQVRLQLSDFAGQERFRPVISCYLNGSQVAIICYDITNEKSFQNIPMWMEIIDKEKIDEINIYIIGNKTDLEDRRVDINEAKLIAQKFNAQYFETSAQSGQQIKEVFMKIASDLMDRKQQQNPIILEQEQNQIN